VGRKADGAKGTISADAGWAAKGMESNIIKEEAAHSPAQWTQGGFFLAFDGGAFWLPFLFHPIHIFLKSFVDRVVIGNVLRHFL
jgi:hypothetical protein